LQFIDFGIGLCENPRQWCLKIARARAVALCEVRFHHNEQSSSKTFASGCWVPRPGGTDLTRVLLVLAMALAVTAGLTDWRWRRIPNWLTVPGLLAGVAANAAVSGLNGVKTSLLGAGLGLLLLLPFVLLRSLGAGDWKLAGALGAIVGPGALLDLLMGSIFVAGVMALVLIIYKRRLSETLRNIGRMLKSMAMFRMPGAEVSLDNPQSLKIPYGVALALTTLLFGVGKLAGRF
jgi:prepilin peptidase CpaA